MKIELGSHTIRSILIVFFGYQCVWWGYSAWTGIVSQSLRDIVIPSVFLLPLFLAIFGLLLRPARSARGVCVLLLVMSASGCVSAWSVFSYAYRNSFSVHFAQVFYFGIEPLITLWVTLLSFVYQRRLHSARLSA